MLQRFILTNRQTDDLFRNVEKFCSLKIILGKSVKINNKSTFLSFKLKINNPKISGKEGTLYFRLFWYQNFYKKKVLLIDFGYFLKILICWYKLAMSKYFTYNFILPKG